MPAATDARPRAPLPSPRRRVCTAAALLELIVAAAAAGQPQPAPEQPQPDALIQHWEQHWSLRPDGAQVYYELRRVRLNSDRAYGEFADAEIVYDPQTQELEVLAARTRMRDGTIVEPPPYSRVEVSPRGASGWPAFAHLRQKVLVLSGIEPGCEVELEYRITTRPGARAALAADVRLDHRYPVAQRIVSVTVPAGQALRFAVREGAAGEISASELVGEAGAVTRRWECRDLPARPDTPGCLPWTRRCARLAFSTDAPGAWLERRLAAIEAAADESPQLSRLAGEWTKDAADDTARMAALQAALAARFHFVSFPESWQPAEPRRASEVLRDNYGLPREAAAVLLALARAAGLSAQPAVLTDDDAWLDEAGQDALVSADVIVREGDSGPEIWHPQHGRIARSAAWQGLTLRARPGQAFDGTRLPRWTERDESRVRIEGDLRIEPDGSLRGELRLRTAGYFADACALSTRQAQQSRLQTLISRLVGRCEIEDFSVTALGPWRFEAQVSLKSSGCLEKRADCHALVLEADGPALAEVSVPLAYAQPDRPVRLAAAFEERIDLRVSWPAGWKAEVLPAPVLWRERSWGAAGQAVTRTDDGVRIERTLRVSRCEWEADDLFDARGPVNELRSPAARTLLLRP